MGYLLDTNVISEVRKGPHCNPGVAAFMQRVRREELFLSVLVVAELRRGALSLERKDTARARMIGAWIDGLELQFASRLLPVTLDIARKWAELSVPDRLPEIDGFLAATAVAHGHILVTRNTGDFVKTGVQILNPF
jgi:hypothetical protein